MTSLKPRLLPEDLDPRKVPFQLYPGFTHPENKQTIHEHAFLGMNLPADPILKLRQEIAFQENILLKGYPEAHITILTPPELMSDFAGRDIAEISHWAELQGLQRLPFQLLGLGHVEIQDPVTWQKMQSYFVVVEAPALSALRARLYNEFSIRAAPAEDHYDPHITVGFTHRDLHRQDGVRKDARSLKERWS